MTLFSFHLLKTDFLTASKFNLNSLKKQRIEGLIHSETMMKMKLGASIFSLFRYQPNQIIVFAQWENEEFLNQFLEKSPFGIILSKGYHLRLEFLRQWGSISDFKIPEHTTEIENGSMPVVAFTLARMRYLEVPRFLKWGKPVEKLVRDHPGTNLSLASISFPNTVATFSVWKSQKEMLEMVHGHSRVPLPKRHSEAMKERNRKDFHFEFTTLRFQPISEYGSWNGKSTFLHS